MLKNLLPLLAIAITTGCQAMAKPKSPNEMPEGLTMCPEQRSAICTREFMPVCGYQPETMSWKTYANKCVACADPLVAGYRDGTCEGDAGKQMK